MDVITISGGFLRSWSVRVGEWVASGDVVAVLICDSAPLLVCSPASGYVISVSSLPLGSLVSAGAALARLQVVASAPLVFPESELFRSLVAFSGVDVSSLPADGSSRFTVSALPYQAALFRSVPAFLRSYGLGVSSAVVSRSMFHKFYSSSVPSFLTAVQSQLERETTAGYGAGYRAAFSPSVPV